ncbi:MAG TPA: hypothetical protein ENK16_03770 [Chromatiales bacterium]|nr:hypothetical protein [Chromatiales bacterium]
MDKFEALRQAADAMQRCEPVPVPAARWIADGMRWFLEHEGASLDQALGLRPPRGGAHLTVWRQRKMAERNRLLHELAHGLHGVCWRSAVVIGGWLRELRDSGKLPDEPDTQQAVNVYLLDLLGAPVSASQIWRILQETVHLHRIPDYSQVDARVVERGP